LANPGGTPCKGVEFVIADASSLHALRKTSGRATHSLVIFYFANSLKQLDQK
jgi:hypothetical protein